MGKEKTDPTVRPTDAELRYPHKLFSGAIIPEWLVRQSVDQKISESKPLPKKFRQGKFNCRQMTDGNYVVCRTGKTTPRRATYFTDHGSHTRAVELA